MAGEFPVAKFNFRVTFTPGGVISFQEVTGLDVENEFVEYRNGHDVFYTPERRVGLRKAGVVTFKKGIMTGDSNLMDLYNDLHKKNAYYPTMAYPINITVELLDESSSTDSSASSHDPSSNNLLSTDASDDLLPLTAISILLLWISIVVQNIARELTLTA